MELDIYDVVVTGFPSSMSHARIKMFVKKTFDCAFKIERLSDSTVRFVFQDTEGLKKFLDLSIKEVPFGNETFALQYIKIPSLSATPSMMPNTEFKDIYIGMSAEEQNKLFDNVHCWSDLKDLPAPSGSKCVLVQNLNPSSTLQVVRMHFESRKRSAGGSVKTLIRMLDGMLVVFNDPNDCDSSLNKKNQVIDQNDLHIFMKTVPAYYERKFLIQGVSSSTTNDHLAMFLERCTEDEVSPISCLKLSNPGVFLITYDDKFDVDETKQFLMKVSSEQLEGNLLVASRLLRSDCIKVTDVPSMASEHKIRMTFESKKRTDGGPVTKVNRLNDGVVLVYFSKFEDAERIANRFKAPSRHVLQIDEQVVAVELYHHSLSVNHEETERETLDTTQGHDAQDDSDQESLDGKSIYYERKFVIEGVGENMIQDDLILYLESCSDEETSPISCVKHGSSGVYLIEYDDEFDVSKIDRFLEKVSVKPFGGNILQASRLLRSHCLKIMGVPITTSDERILRNFESKKRTNGGPVEEVVRLNDGSVLVYFENAEDAEHVYNRFRLSNGQALEIDNSAVTIQIYHQSLSENQLEALAQMPDRDDTPWSSDSNEGSVKVIQFKPSCHEKVFFFIKDSETHHERLADSFKDIAKVELCSSAEEGRTVKCILLQPTRLCNQGLREEECIRLFNDFVACYGFTCKSFKKKKLQKAVLLKPRPILENFPNDVIDDDFSLSWNENTVTIIGRKDAVERAMMDIEASMEFETVEVPMKKEDYRAMKFCGIVEQLLQEYGQIKLDCCDENNMIMLCGNESDTQKMQLRILTLLNAINRKRITDLNEHVRRHLTENHAGFQSIIQDHITTQNIKAAYEYTDEDLYLRSQSEEEHKKAVDALKSLIISETMTVEGPQASVAKSEEWKVFTREVQGGRTCGIFMQVLVFALHFHRIHMSDLNGDQLML